MSGGVYTDDQAHWDFIAEVMKSHITSNPLHIFEFPQIPQFEAEIIRMCLDLYNGPKDSCGVISSGGTESIVLAVLCYR